MTVPEPDRPAGAQRGIGDLPKVVVRAVRLLDERQRRHLLLIGLGCVVVALLEAAGLSMLFLLVHLLQDPSQLGDGAVGVMARALEVTDPDDMAAVLAALTFTLLLAKTVVATLLLVSRSRLFAEAEGAMASELARRYAQMPYEEHLERHTAELVRNTTDTTREVYAKLLFSVLDGVSELPIIIAISITITIIDPLAGLVTVLAALLSLGYLRLVGPRARALGQRTQDHLRATQQVLQEGYGGIKVLKAYRAEPWFAAEHAAVRAELASARQWTAVLLQLPRYFLEVGVLLVLGVVSLLVWLARPQEVALATIAVIVMGGFRMLPSLYRLVTSAGTLQLGQPALDQIEAELARMPPRASPARPAGNGSGDIVVRDLTFRYPGAAAPALDEITFTVPRGSFTGIVGPSGAGKTTLVDLLLGLLEPQRGSISIGGDQRIGYVPQDMSLFDGSVRSNVAFGVRAADVDDAAVWRAVRAASLGDFVEALPDGLETHIGERGVRISGGQRQRLCIARALFTDSPMLILDEATSSLDSETESAITATILALRGSLTILVIAHRMSTVRSCDRLLYLNDGRLEASGTFDQLLAEAIPFSELVATDPSGSSLE